MKPGIILQVLMSGISWLASIACVPAQIMMHGAGASFPYPIYSRWFEEYARVDPSVQFMYQPIGSGGGQKQILEQRVDFGASDGPMSNGNLARAPRRILHIPTVAGAVVVTYNLPGKPTLNLDGPTLVDMFMGRIINWSDPRITRQNPGGELPREDIAVVHRLDSSGTTYIFADYLSSVSKDWESKVGRGTSVKWPTGRPAKGNEGVTARVQQLHGAIGYVELAYAVQNQLPYASIKNSAGCYVKPSVESVTAALTAARIPGDFRFSMVNPPGVNAYPIAGATWLLVYEQQKDPAKGRKLVEFLNWAIIHGGKMAQSLDYAPLPDHLQARVLARIKEIRY